MRVETMDVTGPRGRTTRSQRWWGRYLATLWLAALALRQLPLVLSGRWAGEFNADEGVYFGAAQQLIHGQWPYAHFLFVHPPGITLFLAPFAWLAELTSDPIAAGVAGVAISALGATSAVLVALLLRRYGHVAAITGSALYAVWSATVWAEYLILLEPLLAFGLLTALLLLQRGRSATLAGAALGLTLTVKLWAVVPLAVIGVMLLARDPGRLGVRNPGRLGVRRAAAFAAGALAAVGVVLAPFLVVAGPAAVWRDVVTFQAGRPADGPPPGSRPGYFNGSLLAVDRLPSAAWLILGIAALVVATVGVIISGREHHAISGHDHRAALLQSEPTWWLILAATQLGMLLAAPSFYPHYTLAAAPALCLVIGICAQTVADRVRTPLARRLLAGAGAVLALAMLAMSARSVGHELAPASDWSAVAELVDAPDKVCAWAPRTHILLEANLSGSQARNHCPTTIDTFATVIAELRVPEDQFLAMMPQASHYQTEVATQLAASNLAIVDASSWNGLAPGNQRIINQDFAPAATVGPYTIWKRTTPTTP